MEIAYINKINNNYFNNKTFTSFIGELKDLEIILADIRHVKLNNKKKVKNYIDKEYLVDNMIDSTKKISKLSFSEKQFIKLICAIKEEPELIILNNYDLNLNPLDKLKLINLLRKINHEKNIKFIIISNDTIFLNKLCQYLIMMKNGIIKYQGNIINAIKQNRINKPNIIRFIESANELDANIDYSLDYKEVLKSIYRSV